MTAVANITELRQKFAGPDQLSELFHMVNRILPEDQVVLSIPPETTAGEALKLMKEHGFSQLPVVERDSVLGLFSYRSFALEIANNSNPKLDAISLPVEEFLGHEKPKYAKLTDEFRELISTLDEKDSVVVSGPENLVAILTPMDVLHYLYSVANCFVLIEEIEGTLRALIREAVPDLETFSTCVAMALSAKYKNGEFPKSIEEMTFDEYIGLLRDGRTWKHFHPIFGGTRDRVRGKLEPIRDLRNDVFHFRRELTAEDHQQLSACRDWLFRCSRKISARREGGKQ